MFKQALIRLKAIIKIQKCWRKYTLNNKTSSLNAAHTIQKYIRGYVVFNKYLYMKFKKINQSGLKYFDNLKEKLELESIKYIIYRLRKIIRLVKIKA